MKKLITSLLIILMSVPVFSQTNTNPPKTFQIHAEKRPFIKKGDRKRKKGHHHPKKQKIRVKKHLRDRH